MKGRMYLTVGRESRGRRRLLAVISDGSPQYGDNDITVLNVEIVQSQKEAEEWFERMKSERPWETRQ